MLTLDNCLGANRPLIFVAVESDVELLNHIKDTYKKDQWLVYSSSLASLVSLQDLLNDKFNFKQQRAMSDTDVFDSILKRTFTEENKQFVKVIFLDAHMYINDAQNIRKIKDIVSRYQLDINFTVSLVFVSQIVCVPQSLERLGELVFFDLPDEDKIKKISEQVAKKLELKKNQMPSVEVVNNLRGLTAFEIEQAYLQSYHLYQKIELGFIRDFKKNAIAKTDLLSLMETDITFDDIGGMEKLKEWIRKSAGGWTVEGKEFGLPLLKGVLLVGLPGCGKSLIMKAIGNEWGLPVVSFDPSRIFSSRVGDSENNMRRVLKIVENMAPCLSGDTRITMDNGQVASIKELYDNQYRGRVISINKNFDFETSNILLITKKKSNDLYDLKTIVGNIKATGNHQFPVLKSNGTLQWVEVADLKKGEYIVCPRQIKTNKIFNLFNYIEDKARFYSEEFCKEFLNRIKKEDYEYYLKHGRRVRINKYVTKEELIKFKFDLEDLSHVKKIARGAGGYQDSSITKILLNIPQQELFYVLGLLWSDGNIGDKGYWLYDDAVKVSQKTDKYRQRNQNSSKFYGNELVLHEKISTFFKKYFHVELSTVEDDYGDQYITSSPPVILCEILRRIQKDILSLTEDCQWAWLCGVLDGDGHIHKQRINFAAAKYLNNEYIRDVLLRVGIPTSSYKDNFKNKNVEITSYKFITKFYDNATLCHPKKIEHFCTLKGSVKEPKCRSDSLDIRELLIDLLLSKDIITSVDPVTIKDKMRKQSIISDKVSVEGRDIIHNYINENRNIDIDKIKGVFKELGEENNWFLKGDFFFAPILEKNKIQGDNDVYDLCLDRNFNFIANRMFTHNCILSIDEIEKGLAGMQSSTFSDSGVTARVIGSFLIWMQDCTKPVFIIATANNIQYLPPELINRFDETFFVNLPQHIEREEIFNIHLKKLNRKPEDFDVTNLALLSKDLSGREIEQTLREAMYNAFYNKDELTTDIIMEVLNKKTNLLTTMAEQLKYLLKWVGWDDEKKDGIRARFASIADSFDWGKVRSEIDDILKEVEKKPGTEDESV